MPTSFQRSQPRTTAHGTPPELPRRRSAFTLLELVIVTAILGILAGVALPRSFAAADRHLVRSAAHRVAADLRYARQQAIQRSTTITVAFYPASEHYQIDALNDLDHASLSFITRLQRHYPGVDLQGANFGGGVVVSFDHYGQPSSLGTVKLGAGDSDAQVTLGNYGEVEVVY